MYLHMARRQFVTEPELGAVGAQQLAEQLLVDHSPGRQAKARVQDVVSEQLQEVRHVREGIDLPKGMGIQDHHHIP